MHLLAKILQQFLYPFNVAVVLLVAAWLLSRRRPRTGRWLLALGLALLVVPGMPVVGRTLLGTLEWRYPTRAAEDYPAADAIVVLGGSTEPAWAPRHDPEESGSPRLLQAVRLYRAGKAPRILLAGGGRYEMPDGRVRTEAGDMTELLIDMGVPADAIESERLSRNTYENAVHIRRLMDAGDVGPVLLVTSAWHLPRSMAIFRRQGIDATPVPSSYRSAGRFGLADLLPSPAGLDRSTTAIREHAGYVVYRLLGRL